MEIYNYNPYKRRKTYKYIFIYTPLNINLQKELVKFCNNNYKNNPIIFIKCNVDYNLYMSIYHTLSYLNIPNEHTFQRKTQNRFIQTGFPYTLKTKCSNQTCNNHVVITQKYISHQHQHLCLKCKKEIIFNKKHSTELITMMNNLNMSDNDSMDIQ